ncbi:MAG: hypothetical protein M3450_00135 [Actinomycetota bacterium]|nr:hypothetical protein [Actinomycetota bacterium]
MATVLLLLWQRHRSGRVVSPVLIGLVASGSSLASWQGMLTAALLSGFALWRLSARWEAPAVAVPLGTLFGVVAVVAWVYWVYGSLDQLWRVSEGRSDASLVPSLKAQVGYARSLYPLTWALIPSAFVGAVALRATRAAGVMAVTVVLAYGLLFRSGALIHDYWNYWAVLPMAIGFSVLLNWLFRRIPARAWPIVPAIWVAILGGGLWLTARAPARLAIVAGERFGHTIANTASRWPSDQRFAFYEEGHPFYPILTYYTGRPPRRIRRNDVCTPPNFLYLDVTGRLRSCGELRR